MIQPKPKASPKAQVVCDAIRQNWRTMSDREIAVIAKSTHRTVGKYRKQMEARGEILPRVESIQGIEACLYEVDTSAIEMSPGHENDALYAPIRRDDPEFTKLVNQIRDQGILEPLVVSIDGYILSGHRRHEAARVIRLSTVPVRIHPIRYSDDPEEFRRLLPIFNTQRVKTSDQVMREGILLMDGHAWQNVRRYRREKSQIDGVEVVELRERKGRSAIVQKKSFEKAIVDTVFGLREEWPVSDRSIFYKLLNIPGLLRNDVQKIPFANDENSYDDVTDMCTRMRISGAIPFDCIADETRPVVQWNTHKSVGTFIDKELENLFAGYWRELQQSQPCWIELLVEKNTVASSIRKIAAKYTIPMTSGRGYSSLPPRKGMVDRFRESGRERLVVIVVSDFDPEGVDIPHSFGCSLRDDFDIDESELSIVKAALTHDQVQSMDLHEGQFAKDTSARYKPFVELYGKRCWELEAVSHETLREIVESAIRDVLDLEAFEAEVERQREDQEGLDEHRERIREVLVDGGLEL